MSYDEVSMERSTNFVNALQELKSLRPQLYSAAEYCEKSYLHSEQKEMVLDNLKNYAVRALVNAVDHLGTVAYKLTDLLDQQTLDVSTMDLKLHCVNQNDARQSYLQAGSRLQPSGLDLVSEDLRASDKPPAVFHLLGNEESMKFSTAPAQLSSGSFSFIAPSGVARRDMVEDSKSLVAFRPLENTRHQAERPPVRSRSMLSAFFVKQKSTKAGYVSNLLQLDLVELSEFVSHYKLSPKKRFVPNIVLIKDDIGGCVPAVPSSISIGRIVLQEKDVVVENNALESPLGQLQQAWEIL
ncbi:hypothetical protein ACFE04_026385 [Oxalis oulophora]